MSNFDNDRIVKSFSDFLDQDQISKLQKNDYRTFSLSFVYSAFKYIRPMNAIAVLLVFILAGGSTVFAASESNPSDILYPVKVNFNERVKTIFSDDVVGAEVAIDQISNRYQDIKKVAVVLGDIDVKSKEIINKNVIKHIKKAEEKIEKVKKENLQKGVLLQIELEATLAANIEDMQQISKELNKDSDPEFTEVVLEGQKNFKEIIEKNSKELENQEDVILASDINTENELETEIKSKTETDAVAEDLMVKELDNTNSVTISKNLEDDTETNYNNSDSEIKNSEERESIDNSDSLNESYTITVKDSVKSEYQKLFEEKKAQVRAELELENNEILGKEKLNTSAKDVLNLNNNNNVNSNINDGNSINNDLSNSNNNTNDLSNENSVNLDDGLLDENKIKVNIPVISNSQETNTNKENLKIKIDLNLESNI